MESEFSPSELRERERWRVLKIEATVPFIIWSWKQQTITPTIFCVWQGPTLLQHGRRLLQNFMNPRRWGPLGVMLEAWLPRWLWSDKISFKSPSWKKKKVYHVGSGELIYSASVVLLLERYKVKIQIWEVVNVHVFVPKSQPWGQFYSFLSSVRWKNWHLRGTDWSLADFWDWMNNLNLGKIRDPVRGKNPFLSVHWRGQWPGSRSGESRRKPVVSGTSWDHIKAMVPFSTHFPQRERRIRCQAAGLAPPYEIQAWYWPSYMLALEFKFLSVTKWLG